MGNLDCGKAKVLVADDDLNNLDVIIRVLQDSGHRLSFARSPDELLRIAPVLLPEICIVDVMFRGAEMDGFQAVERLLENPALALVPMVMFTALDAPTYAPRAYQIGAADFVRKPLDAASMLARVASHVHRYRLAKKLIEQSTLRALDV